MAVEYVKPIWLRQAFLLPTSVEPSSYGSNKRRRFANSAAFKFTNASLGGNFAINPLPQYTRTADIRQHGRGRTNETKFLGQGRYYSEAHDDTMQEIVMSFGNPKFSSWAAFFTNFYDRSAASLAATGMTSTLWYNLGNVTGYFVTLPLQPFIVGITGASRVIDFLTKSSPSKWFYFKPSMHAYWSAVNTIANDLAVNMGITPRVWSGDQQELGGDAAKATDAQIKDYLDEFARIFPGGFRYDGGFDIMNIAGRAQRMSDNAQIAERQLANKAQSLADLEKLTNTYLKETLTDPNPGQSSRTYFENYLKAQDTGKNPSGVIDSDTFSEWSEMTDWYSFVKSAQRDGMQFITLRADYNGEVTESFSNTTREVGTVSSLNTKVQEGRAARFDYMEGNITGGVGAVVGAVSSVISGALDSVNLAGLETLTGTAFIDVPEFWDAAMAQLPSASYTITLPNPYGNKLSRFIHQMIPIAMMLPMVLPRAAGRSAYTSPFLCQIFHKGRVQRQLGMCTDFSIRRGTGNVGWNADDEMLNVEISFTIKDLSKLMYMPVKSGFASNSWLGTGLRGASQLGGEAVDNAAGNTNSEAKAFMAGITDGSVWDEQSLFQDYMSTMASMPWSEFYYVGNRLNVNVTKSVLAFNSWRSPSNMMSYFLDTEVARTMSAFANTTSRF